MAEIGVCARCGQARTLPPDPEIPEAQPVREDEKLCLACGQARPYPTRAGKWLFRSDSDCDWIEVEIVNRSGALHAKQDSDMVPLAKYGSDSSQWKKQEQ
jgi:hypothetical protein